MAGGKLTPRQKMINLMYLVFIAMMALNMSKEVLSAFGLMNEKFEGVNAATKESNGNLFEGLKMKAGENAAQFGEPYKKAQQVKAISDEFFTFVQDQKGVIEGSFERDENGQLNYEAMDKSDALDEKWFAGDGLSPDGKGFMEAIDKYKKAISGIVGNDKKFQVIMKEFNKKFDVSDVKAKDGATKLYLDYHYKGFPAVASLTKLSAVQNDIRKTEQDLYNAFIGNTTAAAASMSNYQAIVVLDKNVYFQGDKVTGKVVLGRYDDSTVPTAFDGPGKIENGQAVINATAGAIGEQNLKGKFTFVEDGKSIEIPFDGKYVVVPQPKQANISADKMNVVYRGLPNPMTISFAGIADSDVNASAPGLAKAGAAGKYNLTPASGTEVTVSVTGKLPDGKTVADKKVFRIKNIPGPLGYVAGETDLVKGSKSRIENARVEAKLPDFVYDLNFRVTQFTVKVPGQPSIIVNGDRMDGRVKQALARAGRGDQVTISDIKTKVDGVNIAPPKTAPVIFEIQ